MKASEMIQLLKKSIACVGDCEVKVNTGRRLHTPTREIRYDDSKRRIIISTEGAEYESD